MIIFEDLHAIEAFTRDETVTMLNLALTKAGFNNPDKEFFGAKELIDAFTEQVNYSLHGMLVEAVEELIS